MIVRMVIKMSNTIELKVPKLDIGILKIKVSGKTPLVMDKMPQSTIDAITDKQTGKKVSGGKKLRDIWVRRLRKPYTRLWMGR